MAEPPAAAVTADEQRRQLLTKRVTTVNKLRREICDRRNNLPSVTQSRGIPVPLFPKESWLKYTQRFERWLAKRGQSLAALRNDPSKERNYWFSYAYLRVGPIDTEVDAFGRKRSYSYTSSLQYEPESKRLRRDINDGVEMSRQLWGLEAADARLATRCAAAYSGEEQSRQLLSLSLSELTQASLPRVRIEQHVHDGKLSGVSLGSQHKLKEIPVSLHPGKTILPRRSQLAEENGSRCQDTQERVTSGTKNIRATPTPENYDSLRQRKDVSHTHTAKPKASLPGPPPLPSATNDTVETVKASQLSRSAAATKFAGDAERKSKQVETGTRTPPCQTEVRENLKNSAQLPAPSGQSAHLSRVPTDRHQEPTSADITLHSVPDSGAQTAKVTSAPDALPSWAASLIDRVQELETQVVKLQREVEICHNTAGTRSVLSRELPRDEKDHRVTKACDDAKSLSPSTDAPRSNLYEGNGAIRTKGDHIESQGRVEADTESSPPRFAVPGKNFSHCNDQTSPAPLLVDSGLKRQLVEEYKHLNNLIMTNETAVNDALEFAKTIKEVDDVQAMENQREMIMELVVAINQKKEQRTSALAALITCSWTGDEESLVSLLKEDSTPPECVKHEELAAVLTQMEMKTKEMGHLEEQLSDQTPLVRAFNPFVMEAGKALQDKKIREVSVRLSKEKQAKGELEKECRRMLMCFLQSDAEVRKLVKQSLV